MIRKIKNLVWKILIALKIGGPIQLMLNGALIEDGWYNSYNSKTSIDKDRKPIPWCTYPYIKFIEKRLKKEFNLFEYGCGNSTLWYAPRVNSIRAVEHDKNWIDYISKKLPDNVTLTHKSLTKEGEYANEVNNSEINFHMIIIDGRDRVNSTKYSINKLTDNGVLIFDNTDRPAYKEAIEYLIQHEFKRIDFIGMSPITSHNNYTSVFYRKNNCLNI